MLQIFSSLSVSIAIHFRWWEMKNLEDLWLLQEIWMLEKCFLESLRLCMGQKWNHIRFVSAVTKRYKVWIHTDVRSALGPSVVKNVKVLTHMPTNVNSCHPQNTNVPFPIQSATKYNQMQFTVWFSHWGFFLWNEINRKCNKKWNSLHESSIII